MTDGSPWGCHSFKVWGAAYLLCALVLGQPSTHFPAELGLLPPGNHSGVPLSLAVAPGQPREYAEAGGARRRPPRKLHVITMLNKPWQHHCTTIKSALCHRFVLWKRRCRLHLGGLVGCSGAIVGAVRPVEPAW